MGTAANIPELLRKDPGNALFVEHAERLRGQGQLLDALVICLAGLNASPHQHRGRLLLGRIFFELGYPLFAARELRELATTFPDSQPLQALLARFEPGGGSGKQKPTETISEVDFDLSDLTDQGNAEG